MSTAKAQLVWLASYPKSGNTWTRIFLANYFSEDKQKVSINKINSSVISSSRTIFDTIAPVSASDLTPDEVDVFRPEVYRAYNEEQDKIAFIKTHDAYTLNSNKEPIFPKDVTAAAVCIVRNPFDLAVSFANHLSLDFDQVIEIMNNSEYAFCKNTKRLSNQLRQKLMSWSEHYRSWEQSPLNPLLLKYEDLHADSYSYFKQLIQFLYGTVNEEDLKRAIRYSSFKNLKEEEEISSFKEKPIDTKSFFRKGVVGDGIEQLSDKQKARLYDNHKDLIEQLGYTYLLK